MFMHRIRLDEIGDKSVGKSKSWLPIVIDDGR